MKTIIVTTLTNIIRKGFIPIEISDDLKENLVNTLESSYTVTTDKNLQELIQFTVSEELLKIYITSNIVSSKKLDKTLNFKNLEYIILNYKDRAEIIKI